MRTTCVHYVHMYIFIVWGDVYSICIIYYINNPRTYAHTFNTFVKMYTNNFSYLFAHINFLGIFEQPICCVASNDAEIWLTQCLSTCCNCFISFGIFCFVNWCYCYSSCCFFFGCCWCVRLSFHFYYDLILASAINFIAPLVVIFSFFSITILYTIFLI